MPNAYIFNKNLDSADRASIEAVVQSAGYEPTYGIPSDISALNPQSDIGVVGLPAAVEDVESIDAGMKSFAGAGIRVICIWLHGKGGEGAGVPEGTGKYAMTVDIGSSALSDVLKGESEVWEEPGGAPSPSPKTERNKC